MGSSERGIAPPLHDPARPPRTMKGDTAVTTPKQGNCRTCHEAIYFGLTASGAKTPLNLDGTSHFATCEQADQWRGSSGAGDRVRRAASKVRDDQRALRDRLERANPRMDLD